MFYPVFYFLFLHSCFSIGLYNFLFSLLFQHLWQADFEASLPDLAEREKKEADFEGRLSQSQLVCDMAIIVGDYTILEQFYLNESFKKALAMNTVEEGAHTSSIVDDAFYIIKKSIRCVHLISLLLYSLVVIHLFILCVIPASSVRTTQQTPHKY